MTVREARSELWRLLGDVESQWWSQHNVTKKGHRRRMATNARDATALAAALTRAEHLRRLAELPDHRLAWLLSIGWRPTMPEAPQALGAPAWL